MVKRQVCPGLVLFMLLAAPSATLAAAGQAEREIAYLLDVIAQSNCRFIRNGVAYGAEEARAHIQKKYDHVRSRIRTTEDFIRHVATRSSLTGEPYVVECGGRSRACADWLREALGRFRQE